jgi:hypothetical protein
MAVEIRVQTADRVAGSSAAAEPGGDGRRALLEAIQHCHDLSRYRSSQAPRTLAIVHRFALGLDKSTRSVKTPTKSKARSNERQTAIRAVPLIARTAQRWSAGRGIRTKGVSSKLIAEKDLRPMPQLGETLRRKGRGYPIRLAGLRRVLNCGLTE